MAKTPGKKRKLKDGTTAWDISYYQPDGTRRSTTFHSAAEARAFHAEKVRERLQGGGVGINDMKFRDYAAQHLAFASISQRQRTVLQHESALRNHLLPRFGDMWMSEITRDRVKEFLAELNNQIDPKTKKRKYRPNSLKSILKRLNVILNAAVDDRVIEANPAARIGKTFRPIDDEPERVLSFTERELYSVLRCCMKTHDHCFPIFLLMARTGLRPGEAVALDWASVDFENYRIAVVQAVGPKGDVQKTKKNLHRFVDMSDELTSVLVTHRNEQSRSCFNKKQSVPSQVFPRVGRSHMSRHLKFILERLGLPRHYSPKSFRHTFATLLLEWGCRLEEVQRRMGHTDVSVTNSVYGRHANLSGRAAVNQLDQNLLDRDEVVVLRTDES